MDETAVRALIDAAECIEAAMNDGDVTEEAMPYLKRAHDALSALAVAIAEGDDAAAEAAMPDAG